MKAVAEKVTRKRATAPARAAAEDERLVPQQVEDALAWLKRHATQATLEGMARYAIPSDHALGVSMANIQALAKRLGRNHSLAIALWDTGVYEARMLTAYVDEPTRVTSTQMDGWCADFDNWAICDTLCFALFDRTLHAWSKVEPWSRKRGEFAKRAAFALLASLALHDRQAGSEAFIAGLRLIEREADDDRNFVKKGVSWALRSIGRRRDPELKAAALAVAQRLAASQVAAARWVGKDALRDFAKASKPKPV
ncbi:MAG TPA: DNA alkylation repair protein [Lysobacter sp.]|jgi:3-methyladenine DNA glycosylase AlkD|nr:DNA alkylation repair protein [Lysobacter sp.]